MISSKMATGSSMPMLFDLMYRFRSRGFRPWVAGCRVELNFVAAPSCCKCGLFAMPILCRYYHHACRMSSGSSRGLLDTHFVQYLRSDPVDAKTRLGVNLLHWTPPLWGSNGGSLYRLRFSV